MSDLEDVSLYEPESEIISNKKTIVFILVLVMSFITIFLLFFGFWRVEKDISQVIFSYSSEKENYYGIVSESSELSRGFVVQFLDNYTKQLNIKLQITAEQKEKDKSRKLPVSIAQYVKTNDTFHKVSDLETNFICNKGYIHTEPIKLYNTVIPSNGTSLIYNFSAPHSYFYGYHTTLFFGNSDLTKFVKLRNFLVYITLFTTAILVLQFYFTQKYFSSSMAFLLGITTLFACNPYTVSSKRSYFSDIFRGISYSLFISVYRSIVPVISLSRFPYFNYLPIICLVFFSVFSIILFVLLLMIFEPEYLPFNTLNDVVEYPASRFSKFANPIIIFLSFFGIILLLISIKFEEGIGRIKTGFAAIIQLYSAYTTVTTTFRIANVSRFVTLFPNQGLFYDGFVQIICSLIFSLLYTNVQIEINPD